MKRVLFNLLFLSVTLALSAQKPVKVSGEFRYEGNQTQTIAECKRKALESARLAALAKEFGVEITEDIVQHETVHTNGESRLFDARSNTRVKGEWIADEGEPEYEVMMSPKGDPIVVCRVKGRARALSNEAVQFSVRTLRNGSPDTSFASGDSMTLEFRAPVDGYVAVFLLDDRGNAYTLLPYLDNKKSEVEVKGGVDYVFFNPKKKSKESGEVDELILFTDNDIERNILQVVFSPNAFTRPNDASNGNEAPRSLEQSKFNKWLTDCKGNDKRFSSQSINLIIKN